jgi:FixJ family two-component response regulator
VSADPTVFIVDDDPSILRAIGELVAMLGYRVRSWTSAEQFLVEFESAGPGCLVLDVRMPGISGLQVQRELAQRGATLPIIIITGHGDIRMSVEAMKFGAYDFLEKPFRMQELADCVQQAIGEDILNWQHRDAQRAAAAQIQALTAAEREVLQLVAEGKTNKTIAAELGLSLRAVEDRRARMMKKLDAESRADVMRIVTDAGFPRAAVMA